MIELGKARANFERAANEKEVATSELSAGENHLASLTSTHLKNLAEISRLEELSKKLETETSLVEDKIKAEGSLLLGEQSVFETISSKNDVRLVWFLFFFLFVCVDIVGTNRGTVQEASRALRT